MTCIENILVRHPLLLLSLRSTGEDIFTISVLVQDSEDTRHMFKALTDLGVEMKVDWEQREMVVWGCNGRFPSQGAELFLGNAGTAMRYHCHCQLFN